MNAASIEIWEPVLPLSDIQGIAVPGFFKPHQTLIGIIVPDKPKAVLSFKEFLQQMAPEIATGTATLHDRRQFRARRASKSRAAGRKALLAISFSFQGLKKLTPGASAIPSEAFRAGLANRSAFLGDPTGPKDEGSPANWVVGGSNKELDALMIVAGDKRAIVDEQVKRLKVRAKKAGLMIAYSEDGNVREDLEGHEHFGFDDGVSQPGIRGRASDDPQDFITERHIRAKQQPERSLFGLPGQDLVWPGVLVLGHPTSSPDPLIPGLSSPTIPSWTQNGSFLVFRRLRQDVGLFWRTMQQEAKRLSSIPGFQGMSDDILAARLVGRWPSGAPVNRTPVSDDVKLGENRFANNHFKFDSDAPPLPLATGAVDSFAPSKADPAGITCPWAAHIRKVNTRDSGSDTGGRDSTYARRLLRVGIPFGKSLVDRYSEKKDDPQKGERGLLFLSIQASIENQFEFLMTRWMGDRSRPKMPGGHDIVVGQNNSPGEERVRRCVIFGTGAQQAEVATNAQWIIPTGGGYFFVPSMTAIIDVIAK